MKSPYISFRFLVSVSVRASSAFTSSSSAFAYRQLRLKPGALRVDPVDEIVARHGKKASFDHGITSFFIKKGEAGQPLPSNLLSTFPTHSSKPSFFSVSSVLIRAIFHHMRRSWFYLPKKYLFYPANVVFWSHYIGFSGASQGSRQFQRELVRKRTCEINAGQNPAKDLYRLDKTVIIPIKKWKDPQGDQRLA